MIYSKLLRTKASYNHVLGPAQKQKRQVKADLVRGLMKVINKDITQEVLQNELTHALHAGASSFALWFYPETSEHNKRAILEYFQAFQIGHRAVQAVTVYGSEGTPVEVSPMVFVLSDSSIAAVVEKSTEIIEECDSIATYSNTEAFTLAMVFHENEVYINYGAPS